MSQSLIEERQSRILGILNNGFAIYALMGSEPGEGEGGEGEGKPKKKDDEESEEGEGGEGGEGSADPDAPRSTYTAAEFEALQARLKAADQNRSKVQARLDEIDNANKSELERAQADLAKATERAETAERAATEAKMGREFLKFPGYDWHDPDTALALVDLSEVEIDEDGKVKGMKAAVEKLAKAKPFLLKDKKNNDGDGGGAGGSSGGKPSGHNPQNDGGDKVTQARRDELAKKYRVLQR